MVLALREMLFARTRFLLMSVVLALISLLVVIISGLTAGLVNDGVSGLKAMDSDVIAFANGTQTDSAFTRSIVDVDEAEKFAKVDGVEKAAPLGLTIANAHNQDGKAVDLTLLGVKPNSFIAPEGLPEQATPSRDDSPTKTKHEIVVSSTLQDEGIKVGDTITIDRLEIPLKVVGFTDGQRAGNIAALRAMGATKGFLLRDSLGQAVIILGFSVIVGALVAVGLGSLLETTAMPYATELGSVLSGSAILFVSGLIGTLIAVVRVTRTNPLAALGENR